jgi:uroporphyrinogen III methyltransferase / synthase
MNGPLTGKTVLVTRPSGQEMGLMKLLAERGATSIHWPAIEIQPPSDWTPFDTAIKQAKKFDWAVFTSTNGVRMCFERMGQLEIPISVLDRVRTAAVGPATGRALRRHHQSPKLIPHTYDSKALVDIITPEATGKHVLLIRAEQGGALLRMDLEKIAQVTDVATYQQIDTSIVPSDARSLLNSGDIDVIILTSSNVAKSIINKLEPAALQQIKTDRTRIVTNSSATSQTVLDFGLPVAAQAETSLDDGMIKAVMSICAEIKEDL